MLQVGKFFLGQAVALEATPGSGVAEVHKAYLLALTYAAQAKYGGGHFLVISKFMDSCVLFRRGGEDVVGFLSSFIGLFSVYFVL